MARGRRTRKVALSQTRRARVISNLKRGGTRTGKRFVPLSSKTQRTIKSSRGFSKTIRASQKPSAGVALRKKQTFRSVSSGKGSRQFTKGGRSFVTKDTRKSSTRTLGRFTGMLNVAGKSVRKGRTFVNVGQKGFQKSTQPLRSVSRKVAAQSKTRKPTKLGTSRPFPQFNPVFSIATLVKSTSDANAARKARLKAEGKLPAQQRGSGQAFDIDDVFGGFLE